MPRFTSITTRLAQVTDKAFRIMLSIVLIWPQMAWAMQDPQGGGEDAATSSKRLTSQRILEEVGISSQQRLQAGGTPQPATKGVSSRHLQEEEKDDNSEMSTVLRDTESTTEGGGERESSLINSADAFSSPQSKLNPLAKVETLPLRNALRWASFDSLLQRMGYTLVLQTKHLNPNLADQTCTKPMWLSGGSFPIEDEGARKRVLFVDGFRQGAEFVIFRALHLGITGLALYQLYNYIHQPEPLVCQGTPQSKSLLGLIKFWEASDDNALLGFFHDVLGTQSNLLSYLRYFLLAPLTYGLIQGGINTRNAHLSHEKIQESLEKLAQQTPNMKTDLWRWLLPFNPIEKEIKKLMKNVLWNDNVSDEDLESIWSRVEILATQHSWYTSINALGYAMQWAYGLNDKDVRASQARAYGDMLEEDLLKNTNGDDSDQRLERRRIIKQKAFELIEKCTTWRPDNLEDKKEVTRNGLRTLYAQYLLWSLGSPRSVVEGVWPTVFKFSKLYAQASIIQKIVDAFLKAETCPQQPGVSMAGVASWASDLTQACFEAQVQAFNIIPGQPTDTLVENLGQYYFSNCTIDLDLSNKRLDGETVVNITKSILAKNITIRFLNVSGNNINDAHDIAVLFSIIKDIMGLDLSNNNLIYTEAIGQLTFLTFLDLSHNYISREGGIVIGQSLSNLTRLTHLDFSYNNIGGDGAIAIGQSLGNLFHLTSLDLSNNDIGLTGDGGSIAIGKSLANLTRLTFLDLSGNDIDATTGQGTIAIGQSLSNLTRLTFLDLSQNEIGYTGANGTTAIGQSLGQLTLLTFLDLSGNYIGFTEDGGSIAIGKSLANLTRLTSIRLSHNYIGFAEDGSVLALALSSLYQLKVFNFLPQNYNVPNTTIMILNEALNQTLAPQLVPYLSSRNDIDAYCRTLSPLVESVNLTSRIGDLDQHNMEALMACLLQLPYLTSLNLSNNGIGFWESGGAIVLGQSLGNLSLLTSLDLSQNGIGTEDNETIVLGQSLGNLTRLTFLDLSQNEIYGDGAIAIGQSLGQLIRLTSLDLSSNLIGNNTGDGTIAIGQSLGNLTRLISLDLSGNFIEGQGAIAIGQSLGNLISLTSLDLSSNSIGYTGDGGTTAIGQSLGQLTHLTYLNLSDNDIGLTGDGGTTAIGQSLSNLTKLTYLDLSGNDIGNTGNSGVLALAHGLSHTLNLRILNLGCSNIYCNSIGSTSTEGPATILSVMVQLPHLDFSALNIQGMTNISWTQSANVLQQLRSQNMADACQSSKCFGGDVQTTSGGGVQSSQLSISSISRRLMSVEEVSQPLFLDARSSYEACVCTTNSYGLETCVCPSDGRNASTQAPHSLEPDPLTTLGTSAVAGVVFAAVPEALGDALYLSGMVSAQNSQRVKWTTNAAFVLATGSWMSAGASWLTSSGLQYMGVSESKARVGGNAAAFLINAGRNLSPTIAAATAVNFAAGRAGLWAEKSLMRKLYTKNPQAQTLH